MRGRNIVPPPCSFWMTTKLVWKRVRFRFLPWFSRRSNQLHFHFAKSPISDKAGEAMSAHSGHASMNIRSSIPLIVVSALVIFSPLQEGGTTHVAQMLIRLAIFAWAGGVMAMSIRSGRLMVPVLSVRYVVLAFLGFAVVATIFSPYSNPSRQWLLMIIGYTTLFYLLVAYVDRWEHVHALTAVIVLMGMGEAVLTILQGLAWHVVRPSGTFFNPNFLAGYLAVSWALLLSGAVYGYRRNAAWSYPSLPPVLWWFGMVASLCSLLLAVMLTQSRGGMIVLLISTVFILTVRYGWKLAASCVVMLLMAELLDGYACQIPLGVRA